MKIAYIERDFRERSLGIIALADEILSGFYVDGYTVTLRTLYYQMVARNVIPNTEASYKNLGSIINDARLAGLIDWEHLSGETRNIRNRPHWTSPKHVIEAAAQQFAIDRWAEQPIRPEVWIEKDALAGIISPTCRDLDVTYFSCRGYVSQSEMWAASQRLGQYLDNGQHPIILHFGDHDPSGIDMTRDIADRLALFLQQPIEIIRLALNYDQVQKFRLPPNPAKVTDSRSTAYIQKFGNESWELDALSPETLTRILRESVTNYLDGETIDRAKQEEIAAKDLLACVGRQWEKVTDFFKESK